MDVPVDRKRYPIWLEVSAQFGMFADVGSGSEAYSYPVPPKSACKGIIRSVAWSPFTDIEIVAVALCRKPKWTGYAFNSGTPLRKGTLVKQDAPVQVRESVLVRPRFQILALVSNNAKADSPRQYKMVSKSQAHMMQAHFERRSRNGQCRGLVTMGRKEFVADYFGVPTTPVLDYSTVIPGMCVDNDFPHGGGPVHRQNVLIDEGVLHYEPRCKICINDDGLLCFAEPEWREYLERQVDLCSTN